MPDRVEELRQVQVDRDAETVTDMGLYPPQCSVGGAPWSTKSPGAILSRRKRLRRARAMDGARKAEARIRESWIEDRPQDLRDGLLDDAVHHRRNAEQTLAPVGLGIVTRLTGCGR